MGEFDPTHISFKFLFRINNEYSYPFCLLDSVFWILFYHEGSDVTYLNKCVYKTTRMRNLRFLPIVQPSIMQGETV